MRGGVGPIWGKTNFEHEIVFHFEIRLCFYADGSIFWQYHDARMRSAQTNLIFGTNHPFGDLAPDFRFINFKRLALVWVNSSAYGSYYHFLSGSYIGRTANDLQKLSG